MSQINTNAIFDASGGSTAQINGATPTVYNTMGRNRIINGAMEIDQRNAGASVTPAGGSSFWCPDRFRITYSQDSKYSGQQVSDAPTGFVNSLKITSLSAYSSPASGDYFSVSHRIEGYNVADLMFGTANAKTVTLSFWVKSSLTGSFGASLNSASFARAYPFSYTISSANTWEYKTVTIDGDTAGTWNTTNGIGITVNFALCYGTTYGNGTAGAWVNGDVESVAGSVNVLGTNGATWYITGVQLEVGSVATEFERRPYGTELQLCMRYYQKKVAGTNYGPFGTGVAYDTDTAYVYVPLLQVMRANPTITFDDILVNVGTAEAALTSITSAQTSPTGLFGDFQVGSSTFASRDGVIIFGGNNSDAYIAASAEL